MLRFTTTRLAQFRRAAVAIVVPPAAPSVVGQQRRSAGQNANGDDFEPFDDDFFWLDEMSEGLTDMDDFLPPDADGALKNEEVTPAKK